MPTYQSLFLIGHAHPALPGHFPDAALVPGVVILDQVLALLGAHVALDRHVVDLAQVKFLEPLLPGTVARIEIVVEGEHARFKVQRDDAPIASGSVQWQLRP